MFARVLTATALCVGGLLGAVALVAAPGSALAGLAFGAVGGALASRRARESAAGDAANTAGRRAGLVVGTGVAGAWLAVTGIVLLLGDASGPALLLLLLLLLIAFSVRRWRRRPASGTAPLVNPVRNRVLRAAPRSAPVEPAAPMPGSVPVPADLSTPQLCLAWQRSYFALLDLPADAPRGEVVALRERLLDELERRDPHGFTSWLDTGARAGSNPGRYLACTDGGPGQRTDDS